jgi:hypothetical protein
MTTPTARSLAFLRACGHAVDVVERWLPHAGVRKDLFGCIDIIAVRRGEPGVLGVQCTTAKNMSARINKAKGQGDLRTWIAAGNRFSVFGWHKRGGKWQVKIVELTAADLAGAPRVRVIRRGRRPVQPELFGE